MRSGRSSPTPARRRDLRSVNAVLPDAIAVLRAEEVPDGFSARHDALTRAYVYRVLARPAPSPFERSRALWWPHRDRRRRARGLRRRARRHARLHRLHPHQHATTSASAATSVAAAWRRDGELLRFEIEADAFMRHMNRVLVGTMLEVAGGRRSVADFERLLTGRPRAEAGATAPPHGLYLAAVRY